MKKNDKEIIDATKAYLFNYLFSPIVNGNKYLLDVDYYHKLDDVLIEKLVNVAYDNTEDINRNGIGGLQEKYIYISNYGEPISRDEIMLLFYDEDKEDRNERQSFHIQIYYESELECMIKEDTIFHLENEALYLNMFYFNVLILNILKHLNK